MLRYRSRSAEVAVLLGCVIAAFMGSIAYQAHVAKPDVAALPPRTLREDRLLDSSDTAPLAFAPTHTRAESDSVVTASSATQPIIPLSLHSSVALESTDPTPLPVTVNVRDRRGAGLIDATLSNNSPSSLDLVLESANSSTGSASRIAMQLIPAESRRVGRDEGLFLNAGDTLTVSSPPYQDLRIEVR